MGSASLEASGGSSQALIWASSDLQTWGGPAIRWANRWDPRTMPFALDNAVEQREWESIRAGVDHVAQVLTTALGMLNNDVALAGQV